ncbi:DUF2768 domain-containing protein [Alkalihalobacterium sp. APHAB7]|uniref:DUF2768 domain-containing protein n=1 Tax=Alkalihalobacterium sp. APHAB7 TaxID=3402081 RepID=UPI003AAE5EF0
MILSQAMINMYVSFFAMILMFISVATAVFSKLKLRGVFRGIVLTFSFICLVVSGLIVFLIVIGGPTATL